jgi:O-antigen/teichoic acid export membrane protein
MALIRDTILTYGNRVMIAAFTLSVDILLARLVGPEGKGAVRVMVVIPLLVSQVVSLSIADANVYHIGRLGRDRDKVVWANLAVFLCITCLYYLFIWLFQDRFYALYGALPRGLITYSTLIMPACLLFNLYTGILLPVSIRLYNSARISTWILLFTGMLLFWLVDLKSLERILILWLSAYLIPDIFLTFILVRPKKAAIDFNVVKETIIYGLKTHIGATMERIQSRIDQLLINFYLGSAFIGYYSVSASMAECLWFIPASMGIVLSSRSRREEAYLKTRAAQMCRLTFAFSMLLSIPALVLIPAILTFVYGTEFSQAVQPFLLLWPGVVAYSIRSIIIAFMINTGRAIVISYITSVCAAVNIGLNTIIIPAYGMNGAAVVSSFSYLLASSACIYFFTQQTGIRARNIILVDRNDLSVIHQMRASLSSVAASLRKTTTP